MSHEKQGRVFTMSLTWSLMLNGLLLDGGRGFVYTDIKYLNTEAINLKTVCGAHTSLSRTEKSVIK